MSDLVLAANTWPTNAHLIADCARLGYLKQDWFVLDPTYGQGRWWKLWSPDHLAGHDLKIDGVDFRNLPYPSGTFDAAVFDPPYISPGGRATSTIQEFHEGYGTLDVPKTPEDLQRYNNLGLAEVARTVKRGGYLLAKCKDYISSGRYFPATHYTIETAALVDLELVDRFEHIGKPGRQSQKNQVHARRNLSTLLVFRKR